MNLAAFYNIPDLYRLIRARRGQPPTIGAECHSVNGFTMAGQFPNFFARRRFPDPNAFVVVSGSEPAAVRTEGCVDHRPSICCQVAHGTSCSHIPQPNSFLVNAGSQPAAVRAKGNGIDEVGAER